MWRGTSASYALETDLWLNGRPQGHWGGTVDQWSGDFCQGRLRPGRLGGSLGIGMEATHGLVERITKTILFLRGEKVLLDEDLAILYGVETKLLVRAVKRNLDRFPDDFMFQLTGEEWNGLRCQFGTSRSWGGRRYAPYAFTEQGVAMLSSVLHSERAVKVNIEIMRAFVRLREILASNHELARKLDTLEQNHDAQFKVVFEAIRQLMSSPIREKRAIGFGQG